MPVRAMSELPPGTEMVAFETSCKINAFDWLKTSRPFQFRFVVVGVQGTFKASTSLIPKTPKYSYLNKWEVVDLPISSLWLKTHPPVEVFEKFRSFSSISY